MPKSIPVVGDSYPYKTISVPADRIGPVIRDTQPNPEPLRQNIYVGIDPGQSGGMALLTGRTIISAVMPESDLDVWRWLDSVAEKNPERHAWGINVFAVIEKVHSMPKQGVASSFTFGRGVGFLHGCLTAAGIPYEAVPPQTWMKALGIPPRKKSAGKAEGKAALLNHAQRLYPQLSLWKEPRSRGRQLAICDALLIATFCQRKHEGRL